MEARLDDVEDVLDGERLEVEAAGGVIVRRHRLRVAVKHDRLEAGVPIAATRMLVRPLVPFMPLTLILTSQMPSDSLYICQTVQH